VQTIYIKHARTHTHARWHGILCGSKIVAIFYENCDRGVLFVISSNILNSWYLSLC